MKFFVVNLVVLISVDSAKQAVERGLWKVYVELTQPSSELFLGQEPFSFSVHLLKSLPDIVCSLVLLQKSCTYLRVHFCHQCAHLRGLF